MCLKSSRPKPEKVSQTHNDQSQKLIIRYYINKYSYVILVLLLV